MSLILVTHLQNWPLVFSPLIIFLEDYIPVLPLEHLHLRLFGIWQDHFERNERTDQFPHQKILI